jgi:hypothetical protein
VRIGCLGIIYPGNLILFQNKFDPMTIEPESGNANTYCLSRNTISPSQAGRGSYILK